MTTDQTIMADAYEAVVASDPQGVNAVAWRLFCASRGLDPATGQYIERGPALPPEVVEHLRVAEAVAESEALA